MWREQFDEVVDEALEVLAPADRQLSLLLQAEVEALARGCHGAWLDTFAFQARPFYEKLGYTCFGEIEGYPRGSSRFFMKKDLGASTIRG